jgi:hypothetical protein
MTSRMEKDIANRVSEKLFLWVKDSVTLCEMAEIPARNALAILVCELGKSLVSGARTIGMDKEELFFLLREMWNDVEDRRAGHVSRENED